MFPLALVLPAVQVQVDVAGATGRLRELQAGAAAALVQGEPRL